MALPLFKSTVIAPSIALEAISAVACGERIPGKHQRLRSVNPQASQPPASFAFHPSSPRPTPQIQQTCSLQAHRPITPLERPPLRNSMERRFLRPTHLYKVFRQDCGFAMEDWTSFHGRVQSALLEPRNYVALQKPHLHREAWEE